MKEKCGNIAAPQIQTAFLLAIVLTDRLIKFTAVEEVGTGVSLNQQILRARRLTHDLKLY